MNFKDKFLAGFDIGVKANCSHFTVKNGSKDVYKSCTKWQKKTEKAEKKGFFK